MANIRDQDSWVHQQEPERATAKAKDLVRMAVARAALLCLTGGTVAGDPAAWSGDRRWSCRPRCGPGLAGQGSETILIEKGKELGGMARFLQHTIEGMDVPSYLERLVEEVSAHEKIQVLTEALVVGFTGYKGNLSTEVLVGRGVSRTQNRARGHHRGYQCRIPSQRNFVTARIAGS